MLDLFDLGIQELQNLYQKKEVSPVEVLDQHISHIEKVDPIIHAVCENNFEQARTIAKELTNNFSSYSQKPLFGTPFSIKEMIALEGFKMTAGSIHRRDHKSKKTATVVQRCIEAGAIPVATTNVPEVGFWWETYNPIYGRTNNPYDITRICGGSSGGEAALIAARGTFFGIGSDIGGSIRNPSGYCGISGHKPTNRMLPLTGHFLQDTEDFPNQKGEHYPLTVVGPIARKAADLPVLLKTMQGPDDVDPETQHAGALKPLIQDFSKMRVLVLDEPIFHLTSPTTPEVSQTVRTTAELLGQYGAKVEKVPARLFKNAVNYWFACLKKIESRPVFEQLLTSGNKINFKQQAINRMLGREQYTTPSLIFVMLERLELLREVTGGPDGRTEKIYAEGMEVRKQLLSLLKDDGVLLMPAMPSAAPLHRKPMLTPFDFIYCGIFNAFQFPATTLPIKRNQGGLPLSVQIASAPWNDHLCLSAAIAIENTFGTLPKPQL